jgi:alpha-mannosidase
MWQLNTSQRLRLLERRILELAAWRNALEVGLTDWSIAPPKGETRAIKLGQAWGFSDGTHGYNTHKQGAVRFATTAQIPQHFRGMPVELELDLGGEGIVQLSGAVQFRGGLNPYHKAFGLLHSAQGLEEVQIQAEVVPKSLFGSRTENPSLARAHLVVPHPEVRQLLLDLSLLHQAATALEGHEVVAHLLNAAEDVLRDLDWTSNAQAYLSRLLHGTAGTDWDLRIYWSLPHIPELQPLEPQWLEGLVNAQQTLQGHLERIRQLYPPQGQIQLTGHAHIDLAWLWPIAETQRKVQRTFGTVLELMKQYPDFYFNQSSAQAYAWLEQRDPEMFAQIVARVKEGRWEAIGGMWVEPDGQMLHGESWVRQIQYGQGYFLEKFGQKSSVAWLPDTFGFCAQLPQLFKLGGIENFFTTKLRWNETSDFPHDLFTWQGIDGTTVLAHCFWNVFDSYNAQIDPRSVLGTWRNFKGKAAGAWLKHPFPPQSLLAYGYGDGGGGPAREHLENLQRIQNYPALPKLETTRVDEFFKRLPRENLPLWHGEMYLEMHRGTLTTQAKVKRLHRFLEHRLLEAELLYSLAWLDGAATYPQTELERLWKVLLLHQFHDILPGSSIFEVYEDAHEALGAALETATALRDAAPKNQTLESALVQWAELQVNTGFVGQSLENGGYALTKPDMAARFSNAGWLESFVYNGREYLSAPVCLTYQHDVPREWEAWDINPPHATKVIDSQVRFEPLVDGVRVIHTWRDSSIVQDVHLTPSGIEFRHSVDWHEKRTLLRAEFPVALRCQHAHFETTFGAVERSNHPNTPGQMAAFEVPAHRFVLLEEGKHSLAILNDCKYGFGLHSSTVTMSLLRGSMYPDADMGKHEFRFALDALGDQDLTPFVPLQAATERALEFNSPILAAAQVLLPSDLVLSSLSKSQADNALLLRLYEPCGVRRLVELEVSRLGGKRVQKVDFLEQVVTELEVQNRVVRLEVGAWEVVTLKVWR